MKIFLFYFLFIIFLKKKLIVEVSHVLNIHAMNVKQKNMENAQNVEMDFN